MLIFLDNCSKYLATFSDIEVDSPTEDDMRIIISVAKILHINNSKIPHKCISIHAPYF